jgi:hypothetical protein
MRIPEKHDELLDRAADTLEEVMDLVHDAALKSRPHDVRNYADALASCAGAYRDLVESTATEDDGADS